jgi:four helix bundle protein
VWKRSCKLAVGLYEALRQSKDFGLKNQMQRAAVSIASNIAEGAERGPKEFARFVSIARGSAAELRTQVYIATKVGVLDKHQMTEFVSELRRISRMLTALATSLNTNDSPQKPKNRQSKPKTEN